MEFTCGGPAGGLNPGPPAPETGSLKEVITGQIVSAELSYTGYPLNELLKYLKAYVNQRRSMS